MVKIDKLGGEVVASYLKKLNVYKFSKQMKLYVFSEQLEITMKSFKYPLFI